LWKELPGKAIPVKYHLILVRNSMGTESRVGRDAGITKEPIVEKTYCSENLPRPLFAKEG
jgi:hypothetical protein